MMSLIQLLPDRMATEAEEQLKLEGYLGYSGHRNQSHRSEKTSLQVPWDNYKVLHLQPI